MMLIRPIASGDLDSLMDLARTAGVGMTSLPHNLERLALRIERSVKSFAGELPREEQGFIFVLEDCAKSSVVGICAMEVAVGLNDPWYNYRIGTIVHASKELNVYKRHEALFLSNDHTGYSELCTLFLHPDYRGQRNGSLLSKSRLLFLAQFQSLFAKVVVAEMRGVSDEAGRSPFWDGLGRHFFTMDFHRADYLTGVGQKTFVAELMPKHPIYIDLLPESARAVIRLPHANTRPALALLESEGFRCQDYVDIFDGGPTVQAYTTEIRAVRESALRPVVLGATLPDAASAPFLVCNTSFADFRALLAPAGDMAGMPLSAEQASALQVKAGDSVRAVALFPQARVL